MEPKSVTTPLASTKGAEKEGTYKAIDPSAVHGYPPRLHEIVVDGKAHPYTFHPSVAVTMPRTHAMKFLKAGFHVIDPKGNVMVNAPAGPDPHQTAKFELGEEEVVARYDELTLEALLLRVNQMIGGERLQRTDGKDAMIAFLKADRIKREAVFKQRRNDGISSGGEVEDMPPEDIDKMFQEDAA